MVFPVVVNRLQTVSQRVVFIHYISYIYIIYISYMYIYHIYIYRIYIYIIYNAYIFDIFHNHPVLSIIIPDLKSTKQRLNRGRFVFPLYLELAKVHHCKGESQPHQVIQRHQTTQNLTRSKKYMFIHLFLFLITPWLQESVTSPIHDLSAGFHLS